MCGKGCACGRTKRRLLWHTHKATGTANRGRAGACLGHGGYRSKQATELASEMRVCCEACAGVAGSSASRGRPCAWSWSSLAMARRGEAVSKQGARASRLAGELLGGNSGEQKLQRRGAIDAQDKPALPRATHDTKRRQRHRQHREDRGGGDQKKIQGSAAAHVEGLGGVDRARGRDEFSRRRGRPEEEEEGEVGDEKRPPTWRP